MLNAVQNFFNLRAKRGGSLFERVRMGAWSARGSPPLGGFCEESCLIFWSRLTKFWSNVCFCKPERLASSFFSTKTFASPARQKVPVEHQNVPIGYQNVPEGHQNVPLGHQNKPKGHRSCSC